MTSSSESPTMPSKDSRRTGRLTGLAKGPGGRRLRQVLAAAPPWAGVTVVLVVMCVVLAIDSPVFLTKVNLQNVFQGLASTMAIAAGTTFLLALGLIDLSIGGLLVLAMVVLAKLMEAGLPVPVLIAATIAASGLIAAVINGGLIARAKLNFFVVTLGTASVFQSVAELTTDGMTTSLYGLPGFSTIEWIGTGLVAGIPVPFVIAVLCLAAGALTMNRTNFGQAIRAIGGNETAARLGGIGVANMKMAAFGIGGTFVGIGALLYAGRGAAVDPTAGGGTALNVIAAVLVGGSSFFGGRVTFVGTFVGVVFIAVLENGLNLIGVESFWQGLVTGAVLVAAVWMDRFRTAG